MQAAAKNISDKKGTYLDANANEYKETIKTVTFEQKGKTLSVEGEYVLCATGRGPNTDNLGLDDIGITYDRHGIKTNDNIQTNVEGIYAIGDVNGKMQLAHAAEAQGKVVVDHILSRTSNIRLDLIPWAVFTTPELAGIASPQTEGEVLSVKSPYRSNGKALAMDATDGLVKINHDEKGRILGCQVLGAHAADLVQEVTALMNKDATMTDLESIIHIHPTLQELL